jgi:hypothetical protein
MADELKTTSRRSRRWLRWIGIIFGALIVLLVVAYFVGTSEWALKSIILPKVSTSMNAQVTVDGASISPFSSVDLRGLKVHTTGKEPLFAAQEVRAHYSLMDIIKGNINVSSVELKTPVVNLITFADGTSNLDPLTKSSKEEKEKKPHEPKEKKSEKPPQVNLQNLTVTDLQLRKIDERKDGTRQTIALNMPVFTLNNIGNDKEGKLVLSSVVNFDQGLKSASNGVITAKLGGEFNIALDSVLKPKTAKGKTQVDVTEAKGAFAQAAGLGVTLNTDLTPTQLNDVSLRIAQNGKSLGALAASGPFSAETMEGKLNVVLSQIDRQVLNLAGAAMGIDFNQTAISSTNTIELAQKGRVINVNGQLLVGNFSVTQKGQTTPALDVRTGYAVTYDQTNKTALVQSFTLNGTQNNAEFLRGTLAKPMLLELGKASGAVDESAFDLVVTNFNLPDWRTFIGTNVNLASGRLGLTLNLLSQQAGKKLSLNLATQMRDLSAAFGSNRIDNADIGFTTKGTVQDFSAVNLESYRAELARGGQTALTASGALQYNTKSQDADVQANLETSLPQVASLVSVPGLNVSAGTVKFAGRIVQKNTTPQQTNNPVLDRAVTGKLDLENFTGAFQSNRFDRFLTALILDVAMRGDDVTIRKCSGALRQSDQAGGGIEVTGNYNLATKSGEINAQLLDLNQNTLKSFLAAALGEKQLESIAINSKTTAKLGGADDIAVKTELHVANLVVNDPSGQIPKTPLAVDLNADVSMANQVIDLRGVQLALTKTERAPNSLNIAGRIDQSKSNAWTGNLKINSDGLDVTTYYDLFAKKQTNATQTAKSSSPKAQSPPKETKPEAEPPPVNLPFTQFTEELNIAKFFLHDIAISNLVSKTTIENGRVNVNPFSLSLNGAPVNLTALINLAVAGYEYNVDANLNGVPVEPLVNTFAPEKRGQMKGDLFVVSRIKGAGVTGKNLQKNLAGDLGLSLTNANIQVTQYKRLQKILAPIALALRIPQLSESPLNWVDARAIIGNGTVTLPSVTAESSVFRAGLAGTVSIAEVLTNSVLNKLPVDIALRKNIADVARLTPPGTPADAQFVPLPKFVSVAGTVGDPKTEIDKIAVTRLLAGTVGNYVGGDAGKILRGVGNLGSGTSTNATSTNTTGNLIQGLGTLLQRPPKTNAPPANQPARKKNDKFNPLDLLK